MPKFTLELLYQIIGIGSASGLLFKNNTVFLISDNSNSMYEYHLESQELNTISLIPNTEIEYNISKNTKPDFEAITVYGEDIFILGSGSAEKRNLLIHLDNDTHQYIQTLDLSDLYLSMQFFAKITPEDFNIEGVVYNGSQWYFLQRGNGKNAKNGIFIVKGNLFSGEYSITYKAFKLPKIKNVRFSFTDAVGIDDTIYFLAAAENSKSTYRDGKILGSMMGIINTETLKITHQEIISQTHKFEGITLYKKDLHNLEFLLCEDNDTADLQSDIYKLTLKK